MAAGRLLRRVWSDGLAVRSRPRGNGGCDGRGALRLLVLLWLWLWQPPGHSEWPLVVQLFALDVAVLAVCLWAKWLWLRLGAVTWTSVGLLLHYFLPLNLMGEGVSSGGGASEFFWAGWIWAFFAIFTADLLIRAWCKRWPTTDLEAYLTARATQ